MATLISRREMERHQLRQKHVEATAQQQILEQQQQQQAQKQPSPTSNDRFQYSPPPSYSQASYSPILRDHIYQNFTPGEQTIFERGLSEYEQRRNLVGFVECLRVILNTNQKRQLIFAIREYAIRSSDYKKFNKLLVDYGIAASVATSHTQHKTVKKKNELALTGVHKVEIKKDPNGDWGFNIRGGSEHGVGIFVSWVNPGSDAALKGLKVGDQVLKANDVNFEGISHQNAVQIMSSVKKLRLFVLSKGLVPHTQVNPQKSFVWVDVNGQSCTPPMFRHGRRAFQSEADERKITLVVEPGKQLGISIRGGNEHGLGIYISEVDEGSVADTYGLKVGDQILEVNGMSFARILHSEAANILKTNTMLIIVVKDVGKLPYSRATTQTQWHSSQPNFAPANRINHPSDEKLGFKRDIGKQVMHDQYSGHPSHIIMNDKVKSLLSESEWRTFNYYITQYKQHKLRVEDLVIALIDLLDTTEKYKLISEIRSIIFPKDMNTFNKLTVHKEMLTRKGGYDVQHATKYGGSGNSINSSSAESGSQDSITQNARAILDNFTLQPHDSDSEESVDGGFGSGGIQLKSYVQTSSYDSTITPERHGSKTSEKSHTNAPRFYAPPPPSTPPTTSTPQGDNLQDILTDTLKERRKQLHPKDSFLDSSNDDTITFNNSKTAVPHVVVTGSQESLLAVIQESVRREKEEKMMREQREKERRFQEAKERRRMQSNEQSLEDKIEEIEARIKREYKVTLEKEREKLAELQRQETERREELDRLENERKRQSRANFQESVRSEVESEIRGEFEKLLKVEKEEKEQLQLILAQQRVNEEAITELETKIRENVQRQAREEFEQALQKEREEMQKREQAERRRREEIEQAQKRMEVERLEAEEQMRIEIEERVAREAEQRARLEYEERLQKETTERARLAEEIKTHREIEERLEQQIQQQKEEMERQIALEKKKAEELIEKERLAIVADNAAKEKEQKKKEEQKRKEEEQRKREETERKRREEEQRKREETERKRKEEEQRKREETERKRREEEQRKREETEHKRREEEQRKREETERKKREEEERKREEAEQKQREQEDEEKQLEQLLLIDDTDSGSLQQLNTESKKVNTQQTTNKNTAIREDRERAEKMLQQRMLMAKQKGTTKSTSSGSKEGGMSYAKQAGVVGKKGFSYAGYTGLVGDMITITITKVTKRLGIAVNGGNDTKQVAVKIKEIIAGGSAALTGQGLRVGQQILQVNNTTLKGLKHREAVLAIKNAFDSAEKTMNIIVLDPEED